MIDGRDQLFGQVKAGCVARAGDDFALQRGDDVAGLGQAVTQLDARKAGLALHLLVRHRTVEIEITGMAQGRAVDHAIAHHRRQADLAAPVVEPVKAIGGNIVAEDGSARLLCQLSGRGRGAQRRIAAAIAAAAGAQQCCTQQGGYPVFPTQ
ncbi:hypothetical protein D3C81_1216820 [compost metagenome]